MLPGLKKIVDLRIPDPLLGSTCKRLRCGFSCYRELSISKLVLVFIALNFHFIVIILFGVKAQFETISWLTFNQLMIHGIVQPAVVLAHCWQKCSTEMCRMAMQHHWRGLQPADLLYRKPTSHWCWCTCRMCPCAKYWSNSRRSIIVSNWFAVLKRIQKLCLSSFRWSEDVSFGSISGCKILFNTSHSQGKHDSMIYTTHVSVGIYLPVSVYVGHYWRYLTLLNIPPMVWDDTNLLMHIHANLGRLS